LLFQFVHLLQSTRERKQLVRVGVFRVDQCYLPAIAQHQDPV
jgi:hypothetical protein